MNNTEYKVLLIEDDKLDQMAFKRMLKDRDLPYDCAIARSVSDAQNILARREFDVVISDYSLGDGTAFDVLKMVGNAPVILVTGAGNEELVTRAWKAGAYDYLIKDLDQNYLKTVSITIENAIKHSKAEEILNQKKKNLEAIFDAVPIGMLLVDENMEVRRVNDAIRKMVCKDYLEIINQPLGEALSCIKSTSDERRCGYGPACADCSLRRTIENVLKSQQPVHELETRLTLMVDNKEITLWLCISAELTIIDDCEHVVIAIDDISKRKEAEHRLQLAEEKYRTIFENSAVAITMVDEQERLISWNRFTEDLLGMNKEDLYLRPVKSLYPADEWERIRNYDVRQKGMQHHLETRIIKNDGEVIDIDISLSVLQDSQGKTTGSIGVFRNITDRKRAEKMLQESEEQYRAIFEQAADSVVLIDTETRMMVRFNEKAHENLGYTREEFQKLKLSEFEVVECADEIAERIKKIIREGADTFETRHKTKSDEIRNILVSARAISVGGRDYVQAIWRDITNHKKAEEKLKETMEMKSQFISTVSHELRTPLTCIKNAITNIVDGALGEINEKQRDFLNIAERNADRLARLINDVLDFQKLEAGRMQLNIQENDITKVATEAYETTLFSAKKKNVDFSFDLENNLPRAKFDYDGISRVLLNLISNAIKFTPEQGRVSLSVQKENEELLIRVSDTGMGIPKKDLLKIFDRFYCVHQPEKQISGTGLGLTIVNKIVMRHGGRIEVESQPNQGSTFTVFLPLTAKAAPDVSSIETDEILEDAVVGD
ncbi:MAG: PAS domain-containing sensor histidine kinase [Planctomycetota bacterium]|jgi:PAS domain S-box-containing protein